ncbi:MAG: sodium/solute symporter [Pirellulaceae bacterium]|nr:sodium/solute symporter [Pirellulaceae bacterium]
MGTFSTLDLLIFSGTLLIVMVVGLWAGRKEETTQDFYLAGKTTRWWGVAGSIFGSNISANHMVGMMGVGFTLGFVESQFEISAIAGLLLLCYGFLPVYRRLNVYTLSEYLGRRYNEGCRIIYALVMIVIIVGVQMMTGFYIGSRSLNILLLDDLAVSATDKQVDEPTETTSPIHTRNFSGEDTVEQTENNGAERKVTIEKKYYVIGILIMAIVTGTYTIAGGLKAVIVTDVIQSVMMLVAAAIVAILTLSTQEIGGWSGMMALDAQQDNAAKMHLYLPSHHPERPWTGMLTGLIILHFNYWGTNQFIVQRALSARNDREGRIGIIVAGFFKLLIPFVSIGTGVAAYYLFMERLPGIQFDGDTAFPVLMREVVSPLGAGMVGIVAAGLIGAILSSIDSMLNSGATIVTFDLYRRYVRPQASDRELVLVGRICIAIFVIGAAALAIFYMDPNRTEHFFTTVAGHTSKLVTGIVVAFALGILWRRANGMGALAAILAGIVCSYSAPVVYANYLAPLPGIESRLGTSLNFFHSAFVAAIAATVVHVTVSLLTRAEPEKQNLTWTELGNHAPNTVPRIIFWLTISLIIYGFLGGFMIGNILANSVAGLIAAAWTFSMFAALARAQLKRDEAVGWRAWLKEDRVWAGILAATAVYMMYHYA